ncbi:MAG: glycosyltransferase family 4 protein [Anaerolineae bacterium]|nr:glycosyltransferase family 4 protein [Anaerolineae bacterium]
MAAVGIDYTPAYEQGAGIGRYVRELIAALAQVDEHTTYRLFVAGLAGRSGLPPAPGQNFAWAGTRLTPLWLARLWQRAHSPYPTVNHWLGDLDLYHATDFVLPPVRAGTRTIVQVHDLSFVLVPEAASPNLKRYLDAVVPRSVRRADHVLADSHATKADLARLYGTPPEKITVLWGGVAAHFRPVTDPTAQQAVRTKYGLGDWPFLFTVGTVQPRKNYGRLIEALARLHADFADLHLVIAGGRGWLEDPIYATVARLKLDEYVHFIGFAADEDLPVLYGMAAVVPYLSLYEGFGFPVLEAMACGAPVVASQVSSIPEVAGDAAVLVDPLDVTAITDALGSLLASAAERETLITRGHAQAAQFTWDRSARQLADVYRRILAQ